MEAESATTTDITSRVKLRIPENGKAIETTPPVSVPGLLHRAAKKYGDNVALAYKEQNKWNTITYTYV